MTGRARSRILNWVMVAGAGVLACALVVSLAIGIGPSWSAIRPLTCMSMAIDVAADSVGEPTPEAALELWLNQSAPPLTPRVGWFPTTANGFVYMINGGRRIEISDLSRGSGSGWTVTGAHCV